MLLDKTEVSLATKIFLPPLTTYGHYHRGLGLKKTFPIKKELKSKTMNSTPISSSLTQKDDRKAVRPAFVRFNDE